MVWILKESLPSSGARKRLATPSPRSQLPRLSEVRGKRLQQEMTSESPKHPDSQQIPVTPDMFFWWSPGCLLCVSVAVSEKCQDFPTLDSWRSIKADGTHSVSKVRGKILRYVHICMYNVCTLCHAISRYVMLCHAMSWCAFYAMLCRDVPCYAMLCHAMPCFVMLCHVLACCVMMCHAMSCYVVVCHAMSCRAMLCHDMPCYDMRLPC